MSNSIVKLATVQFDSIDPDKTLPAKFKRLLSTINLKKMVKNKVVALKMHLGGSLGYTTIPPLFVKILVEKIKENGGDVFITDLFLIDRKDFGVNQSKNRGYSEDIVGAPIIPVSGFFDKYYYSKPVNFKTLKEIQIAGHIHDAEVLINFSHFKGHGVSSFGGAIKNLAMGCVTKKTRQDLHFLHSGGSGIKWDEKLCNHCKKCIQECRYKANKFNKDNKYEIMLHNCTYCLHCVEICPNNALSFLESEKFYLDFQKGMAISAQEVLKTFKPQNVYHINALLNITFICDCWGMSTPPLIQDIGIVASNDIVSVEKASLDIIKDKDVLPNSIPSGWVLREGRHLFEKVWGKDPYLQLQPLIEENIGNVNYEIEEIK